jgi:hypothetical protein
MPDRNSAGGGPPVPVILEFDSSLSSLLDASSPYHEHLRQAVAGRVAELLRKLGIPGEPVVTLAAGRLLRVTVNGQLCRYSVELLHAIHAYVRGTLPDPDATPANILSWLHELLDESSASARSAEMAIDFLILAPLEIIKESPRALLGHRQLEAYLASLPRLDAGQQPHDFDADRLHPVLGSVLNLRISLADTTCVLDLLESGSNRLPDDLAEDLIAALVPPHVEIQMTRADLRQFTTENVGQGSDMFRLLRKGLFAELGLRYPPFHFVAVDHLKPGTFAFQINHLATPRFVALRPGYCLVNETVERVALFNVDGLAVTNLASGYANTVVPAEHQEMLEAAGLKTWGQMDYLLLCLEHTLRTNGACFVHHRAVVEQFDTFEGIFPAVARAARAKASVEQITRLFRALAAEELSVQNLLQILERLVEYKLAEGESGAPPGGDAALIAYIRAGMQRYISHKHSRGTRTVVVYLLDAEIERVLLMEGAHEPEARNGSDPIVQALKAELAYLPQSAQLPVLLTCAEVRPILWERIHSELPRLRVTSYDELATDFNVQPVARISL